MLQGFGQCTCTDSSGGSRFVIKSLSVWSSWSRTAHSSTDLIFLLTFIKTWLMLTQSTIYCWIETTTWTEIEKSSEYKFYDDIRDLATRFFIYHNNDTKKNPLVMLCPLPQLMTHSDYLNLTVYFAVMLQAFWHTAEDN